MRGETVKHWVPYMVVPIVKTSPEMKQRIRILSFLLPLSWVLGVIMSNFFSEPEFLVPGIGLMWLLFVLGLWGVFGARKFDKLGTLEFSKEGVSVELGVRITNFKWKDFDEINFCYLNSPVRDQRIPSFNQIERCFLAFTVDGKKHFYYYAMSIQEMAQCSQNLAVHLESLGLLKLKMFNVYGRNDIPKEVEEIKKDYLNE